jgi:DNA-binding CsgD family transcriptional regulator
VTHGDATVSPLLEREFELRALRAAVGAARAGKGRLALVEGEAGIGKSSLLGAVAKEGREAGLTVLSARGTELEIGTPLGVAVQLFEPLYVRAGQRERERLLSGAGRLCAPLLRGEALPVPRMDPDPIQPLVRGLYWVCANLAESEPLLICLDDLHWADEQSLRWLAYLAERVDELPVVVVSAARTGERGPGSESLERLATHSRTLLLRPAPLGPVAVTSVLENTLGERVGDELGFACLEVTRGNPFLLGELVSELRAEGIAPGPEAASHVAGLAPESVGRAVLLRLRRLPSASNSLARALAIFGEAPLRQVAALAAIGTDEAAGAADALFEAGIVRANGEISYAHPITRTAIEAQIAPLERARAHGSAATILHREGAAPARVVSHLLKSEPSGESWAVEVLRDEARRVYSLGAPETAARFLLRALEEPLDDERRTEILIQLGEAEIRALDPTATEHLEAAVRASAGPGSRRRALLELGRAQLVPGRMEEAVVAFEAALAECRQDREFALQAEAELASAQLNLRAFPEAVERLAPYHGLHGDTPGERMVLAVSAFAAVQRNRPAAEVRELAARALEGGRLLKEQTSASLIVWEAVIALLMADGYALAERVLDDALADARERGWAVAFAAASSFRAWRALRRGEVREAEAEARAADEVRRQHGLHPTSPMASALLLEALRERGELDEATAGLAAADLPEEIPDAAIFQFFLFARGRLRIAQGHEEEGLQDVLLAGHREMALGGVTPAALDWRSTAAPILAAWGRREEAQRLTAEELELARAFGAPRALGIALRAAGLVAEGDSRMELLHDAADALEDSDARLEHARALVDLGAAIRRSGRRRQAREPLRRALDITRGLGASALAERAREELSASGARPRREALKGRDALTPSELRVAQMAAGGRSNRKIAEDLFVTVRTVEFHLSRAYDKLEIHSRAELGAALENPEGHESAASRLQQVSNRLGDTHGLVLAFPAFLDRLLGLDSLEAAALTEQLSRLCA